MQAKAVKELIETEAIKDRRVPDDYLNDLQRRVKVQTLSREPFFDHAGAAAELAQYNLPAYFLDFETISFAVPIWKGTRPYRQIPFQFSCHALLPTGELNHSEFLDLSGDDPSVPFAEALIDACGQLGPVFVYYAGFEAIRRMELVS